MKRLLVAVLLSLPSYAQSPEEWDVERRLAERFDETRNAERLAVLVARAPKLAFEPEKYAPGSRYYVIEGKRNPELFLPHELFRGLVDEIGRPEGKTELPDHVYGRKLADFGWEAAPFWTTLSEVSARFRELEYRTTTAAERVARCRALYDALEGARATFGQKEFDAFLYKAIAEATLLTKVTSEPNPAATLRREARGCQPEPDPPGKQVWEWTVDERVAARLVAADRKRRVSAWMASWGTNTKSPKPFDYIEGKTRPELLLPTEIVDVFIEAAFVPDAAAGAPARADAADGAVEELGLPPEFFPAFEKAFARAIAAQRERARILRPLREGQVVGREIAIPVQRAERDACRGRWKGIQALRATYGATFDRFLYEVLARNVRKTVLEPQTAESLRAAARGCP